MELTAGLPNGKISPVRETNRLRQGGKDMNQESVCIVIDSKDQLTTKVTMIEEISAKILLLNDPDQINEIPSEKNPHLILIQLHDSYRRPLYESVSHLKEKWPTCPILIHTTDTQNPHLLLSLASGADDFITETCEPDEFLARVSAAADRLHRKISKQIVEYGDIVIDSRQKLVIGPKGKVLASPIELNLLNYLAAGEGEFVKKEALKIHCWGQIKVTDNALHRKLHAARQLLKEVSDIVQIRTKYGVGFTLSDHQHQSISRLAS